MDIADGLMIDGSMLSTIIVTVGSVAAAFVVAFGAWRIARRSTSGAVATSDAAMLWTESSAMRTDLRNEIVGLRAQLAEAITKINDLLKQIDLSNTATATAREETRLSRAETAQLRLDIAAVHSEVQTGNALTLGALADRVESRRIALIPSADRTAEENEHIDTVRVPSSETEDESK